jgi:hypothetical protein
VKINIKASNEVAPTKEALVSRIFSHTEFNSTESNHKYFVKKVAIALAIENPIITKKTIKEKPLLSFPVLARLYLPCYYCIYVPSLT